MMKIHIDGDDFEAEDMQEGVLINPVLPEGFGNTDNDERPAEHDRFWDRPYVETRSDRTSTPVVVKCLDGGAWDRPTTLGRFATVDEAIRNIKQNSPRRYPDGEFVMAAMCGLLPTVTRLKTQGGWGWAVQAMDRKFLAIGIEPTRAAAKSAAVCAAENLLFRASRSAA